MGSSIADGFEKTFVHTAGISAQTDLLDSAIAAMTTNVTFESARFLPKWVKDAYAAADLRFDPTVTGQTGVVTAASSGTLVWAAATMKGAAQLASAATAAAIVALTF